MHSTLWDMRLALVALMPILIWTRVVAADPIGFVPPLDATSREAVVNPDDVDTLKFFVANQYTVDDNLFRLPAASSYLVTYAGPNASRAERIDTISAGIDGQRTWNRQTILLDVRIDDNRFSRNEEFNGKTGNGKLEWDWQSGPLWIGQAGVIYNRFIPNFQDSLFYSRDIFSTTEYFGKAQFQGGPHWNFVGGLSEAENSNSNVALRPNDFHSKSGNFGAHYFTLAEDSIGWDYLYTDGTFTSDVVINGLPYNRAFRDNSARFSVKYSLTPKTVLDANAGYLSHNTASAGFGSFSGNVWRASLQWQPLAKTQFVFAGWRDVAAYRDAQSAFFVSRGYSVTPTWIPRDKITISLLASRETHDFLGSGDVAPALIPQFTSRQDKLTLEQVSVAYSPRKALSLKLSYQYQQRDSNIARFSYDDNLVSAALTVAF